MEHYYTISQLHKAEWFPYKSATIRKLIKSGKLKVKNVSLSSKKAKYAVSEEEVNKFLNSLK